MRWLLVLTVFLLSFSPSYGQQFDSSHHNIDSFSRAIDSLNKEMSKQLQERQDSFDRLQQKIFLEQNSRNLDRFLADMKEREQAENRQMYIRIGLGVAFLAVLVVGLLRRRRGRRKESKQQ